MPRKQRHTAHRIFERLRDEHGFTGGYTIVKDYVRARRQSTREAFVPLHHPPGHAQVDFGEAVVEVGGRPETGSELLFDVFSRRYENGATIVTSNLPFQEWTTVFASERLTGALLAASLTMSISWR